MKIQIGLFFGGNSVEHEVSVISALQAFGYNLGDGASKKIPVFGVDATQVAQDAIAADTMTGTVKQDAQGMADAICAQLAAVAGGATMAEAAAKVAESAEIFSLAEGFTNKVFVAYAPYTGE